MKRKDYISGVYRSGVFNAYGIHGDYRVKKFEAGSNEEARRLANAQGEVHGTFKDGIFRPANLNEEQGFANHLELGGRTYKIDQTGQLYGSQGKPVGRLDRDGKPNFYKAPNEGISKKRFEGDVEGEENERFRDIGYDFGQVRGEANTDLTNLANYITRSNRVLGKFRKAKNSYDPENGTKIKIYEAEIPQYDPKSGLGAGFNAETKDGREHIVVVDKRLKPYEKIAIVAHELSHVYGGREIRSHQDKLQEEHEAHLGAINQLCKLYEDYDNLRRATSTTANPFFDVTKQSKTEVGRAIAYLVRTKSHFGIRDEELSENKPVLKKVKHDLEARLGAFIAIPSLLLTSLFLSNNITGNAVADISVKTTSFVGGGLFIIGLIGSFFYLKNKRFNKKF